MALGALIGTTLGTSAIGAGMNAIGTSMTNRTNLKIARETNAANAEQADLAYRRSLPVNQVANLVAAGMSKAGALSSLTGGGSYTPAAMTGPTLQRSPLNDLGAAFDKVSEIPANVMQKEMTDANLRHINQQMDFERNEEMRKQEMHDADMIDKKYGQGVRQNMDSLLSKVLEKAREKDIDLSSLKSMDDIAKSLDLQNTKEWKNMPVSAYEKFYEMVQNNAREERERISSDDRHLLSVQQLSDLQQKSQDFDDERDARKKEYKLRGIVAQLDSIARSRDLTLDKKSIEEVFVFDKNGNIVYENGFPKIRDDNNNGRLSPSGKERVKTFSRFRTFWNDVSEVIPVNVLGQVLRFILK